MALIACFLHHLHLSPATSILLELAAEAYPPRVEIG